MRGRVRQIAALGLALSALGAGLASVIIGGGGTTDANAASEYTIDILASGFNPSYCQVTRNDDRVAFLNKDTRVRRVIVRAFASDPTAPPMYDSGDIQPGGRVVAFTATGQIDVSYEDYYVPEHKGRIVAPLNPNAGASCSPLPPTPTPTSTPTVTPTPTATPPKPPTPEACERLLADPKGCSVAIRVANDGPLE
jgi:hypothetical protein